MKRMLTSCFGLGLLPVCPGTFGSLPPVVLFMAMVYLFVPPIGISIVMIVWAIAASIICVRFSPDIIALKGKDDPGEIVIDELAGQCQAFIAWPFFPDADQCLIAAVAFGAFRLFDILKPWPIKKLEKLPAGWGILADDLLAGVYAAIVTAFVAVFTNYIYPSI